MTLVGLQIGTFVTNPLAPTLNLLSRVQFLNMNLESLENPILKSLSLFCLNLKKRRC